MEKRSGNQPSAKALEFQKAFAQATALAADRARAAGIEPVGLAAPMAEREAKSAEGRAPPMRVVEVRGSAGKRASVAGAKQSTVSLKHLAATLAENHELPKKQAEAMLGDIVALVASHLRKGDRIRLAGLGVLVVRKRAARMGRNPATGEPMQIKASSKVAFRAAKELKDSI